MRRTLSHQTHRILANMSTSTGHWQAVTDRDTLKPHDVVRASDRRGRHTSPLLFSDHQRARVDIPLERWVAGTDLPTEPGTYARADDYAANGIANATLFHLRADRGWISEHGPFSLEPGERLVRLGTVPPVTIITSQEELDALPYRTVVRGAHPHQIYARSFTGWSMIGSYQEVTPALPVTVIDDPRQDI